MSMTMSILSPQKFTNFPRLQTVSPPIGVSFTLPSWVAPRRWMRRREVCLSDGSDVEGGGEWVSAAGPYLRGW